jgi:hypothetical protein
MHYRIVPTDPEKYDIEQGRWRVTTSAYLYEFRTPDNAKLWAMHWHPTGRSRATFPHLHLYTVRPTGTSPRRDRPSSRRCSGASRWERSRGTLSGAACSPSPRASISCTDRGRRTRHRHQRIGDVSPDRARQDPGGLPRVHPASHNPPSSDCAAPGEGWAEGPSRRDAQAPFRRPAQPETLPRGMGRVPPSEVALDAPADATRSPHTVRRWSAKRPKTANIARRRPTAKVLLRRGFQSQPTLPNHASVDFARRGLGVRFPSSPPSR